jgi:hypothetical protein
VANKEQVQLLKEGGVGTWNTWRKMNDQTHLDLSGADLRELYLSGAQLQGVHLGGADLSKADLSGANFRKADLHGVYLSGANLRKAYLGVTNLRNAVLQDADLSGANLFGADLFGANCRKTRFGSASLNGTNFTSADLTGTDFTDCMMGATQFGNVDLSQCRGLETIEHASPSTIGINTIYRSEGNIPEVFLRGTGVPESLISQIPYLVNAMSPIEFYSCFISYSQNDKSFARRLHDSLQAQGIRCWLDEHQLLPGDDIYHEVDRGIRLWDKMLLCCSENSLKSWWVDNEIGTAFEKEQQLMKEREAKVHVLVPLNLDGYLFSDKWKSGYEAQVRRRLAADFTEASDAGKFDEQVERLIKALRADEGAREKPPKQRL